MNNIDIISIKVGEVRKIAWRITIFVSLERQLKIESTKQVWGPYEVVPLVNAWKNPEMSIHSISLKSGKHEHHLSVPRDNFIDVGDARLISLGTKSFKLRQPQCKSFLL